MEKTETRTGMQRVLALALGVMLACGMAFALVGCGGGSDEDVIRGGIDKELGAFKNPAKENLEPYMGEVDSTQLEQLEQLGIDPYEMLGHALRGFDYTIGDVTVNGDKATAQLTVTNVDVKHAMDTFSADSAKLVSDPEATALLEGGDQAAFMKFVFGKFYEALDAEQGTTTNDVTLSLSKNGSEWTVDDESMTALTQGIYGDLSGMVG